MQHRRRQFDVAADRFEPHRSPADVPAFDAAETWAASSRSTSRTNGWRTSSLPVRDGNPTATPCFSPRTRSRWFSTRDRGHAARSESAGWLARRVRPGGTSNTQAFSPARCPPKAGSTTTVARRVRRSGCRTWCVHRRAGLFLVSDHRELDSCAQECLGGGPAPRGPDGCRRERVAGPAW
jgi:hypothetical protein